MRMLRAIEMVESQRIDRKITAIFESIDFPLLNEDFDSPELLQVLGLDFPCFGSHLRFYVIELCKAGDLVCYYCGRYICFCSVMQWEHFLSLDPLTAQDRIDCSNTQIPTPEDNNLLFHEPYYWGDWDPILRIDYEINQSHLYH